jgi:hypothetical protein
VTQVTVKLKECFLENVSNSSASTPINTPVENVQESSIIHSDRFKMDLEDMGFMHFVVNYKKNLVDMAACECIQNVEHVETGQVA